MLKELREKIEEDLRKQLIFPGVLLNKFRLLNESERLTSMYADRNYFPFYYYLGKYVQPETMLEIGFGLGLSSGCFLQSCKTVVSFTGFQKKTSGYFNFRLGRKNIVDLYDGTLNLISGDINEIIGLQDKWDIFFINDILNNAR